MSSAATAAQMITESIEDVAKLVALTASGYRAIIRELARLRLSSGVVYDAIVARSAAKTGVECLLTLNPDHFTRAWPQDRDIISVP